MDTQIFVLSTATKPNSVIVIKSRDIVRMVNSASLHMVQMNCSHFARKKTNSNMSNYFKNNKNGY